VALSAPVALSARVDRSATTPTTASPGGAP